MSAEFRNILQFLVLPLVTVILFYAVKRKYLWTAPIVSSAVWLLLWTIFEPITWKYAEYWQMLLFICLPLHFMSAALYTLSAYLLLWILKRRKK